MNLASAAAPILVFIAGIATSFSPCALPLIPLVISVTSGAEEAKSAMGFALSLAFALGNSIAFAALGVCAATFGVLVGHASRLWFAFLALLMFLSTLQLWGARKIFPNFRLAKFSPRVGLFGAFLFGMCGGFFSSACATPVLISLLGYISTGGNFARSVFLIFLYALGASTTAVLAGTCSAYTQKLCKSKGFGTFSRLTQIFMGVITLGLGFYMASLCFG